MLVAAIYFCAERFPKTARAFDTITFERGLMLLLPSR